jgi:hypothetical protein
MEKEIGLRNGSAVKAEGGTVYFRSGWGESWTGLAHFGSTNTSARELRDFLSELLGDEVPGEKAQHDPSSVFAKARYPDILVAPYSGEYGEIVDAWDHQIRDLAGVCKYPPSAIGDDEGVIYRAVGHFGAKPAAEREVTI